MIAKLKTALWVAAVALVSISAYELSVYALSSRVAPAAPPPAGRVSIIELAALVLGFALVAAALMVAGGILVALAMRAALQVQNDKRPNWDKMMRDLFNVPAQNQQAGQAAPDSEGIREVTDDTPRADLVDPFSARDLEEESQYDIPGMRSETQ